MSTASTHPFPSEIERVKAENARLQKELNEAIQKSQEEKARINKEHSKHILAIQEIYKQDSKDSMNAGAFLGVIGGVAGSFIAWLALGIFHSETPVEHKEETVITGRLENVTDVYGLEGVIRLEFEGKSPFTVYRDDVICYPGQYQEMVFVKEGPRLKLVRNYCPQKGIDHE
jgi:hypothetical protein